MSIIYKEDGKAYKVEAQQIEVKKSSIFDWIDQIAKIFNTLKIKFSKPTTSNKENDNDLNEVNTHTPKNIIKNKNLQNSLKLLPNLFSNQKELKLKNKAKSKNKASAKKDKKKKGKNVYIKTIYKFIPLFTIKKSFAINKNIFNLRSKTGNKFLDFTNKLFNGTGKNKGFSFMKRRRNTNGFKFYTEKMMYTFSNKIFERNVKFANKKFFQNKIFNVVNNYRLFLTRLKLSFNEFYQKLAAIKKSYDEENFKKKGISLYKKINTTADPAAYAITEEGALLEIQLLLDSLREGYLKLFNINQDIRFKKLLDKIDKFKKKIAKERSCSRKMLQSILETIDAVNDLDNSFINDEISKLKNKQAMS